MTIESGFVSLPSALVALTVKLDVPAVVGVPEITPAVERVKPPGNVPVSTLHVIGVSPVAASVWLYAVPTVPLGNDAVVMVGLPPPPPVGPPSGSPQPAIEKMITATRAIIPRGTFALRARGRFPNSFMMFFIKSSLFKIYINRQAAYFQKINHRCLLPVIDTAHCYFPYGCFVQVVLVVLGLVYVPGVPLAESSA